MLVDLAPILLIAVSTFASEDLACIGAGIAAASGKISFVSALVGSTLGIFVGDLLLFAAGRTLGRGALRYPPFKWLMDANAVDRSSKWFNARGGSLIFSSRFIPGMRLPTYFAAGVLHVPLRKFLGYFALAAVIWTPLIVGAAYWIGDRITALFQSSAGILTLTATGLLLYFCLRMILQLSTFQGRRMLVGWIKRWKWEFWPSWLAYPPIVIYCTYLALRHGRAFAFTVCNPGIPASGLVGESKSDILQQLGRKDVARFILLAEGSTIGKRIKQVETFARNFPKKPIAIKPDKGERGMGVSIVRNSNELQRALQVPGALIVQEYVAGIEFGVMYARHPGAKRGQILSITRKIMPSVVGDGTNTLEHLILSDPRAVCLARHYINVNRHRIDQVPRKNESIQLVELGTHSRGSIFLDGSDLITPALSRTIDRFSQKFKGFYLGRYDVRVPSTKDFIDGRNIKIVELNGVTSEPTHIYDPGVSLLKAYQALLQHWRLAYEIGMENVRRGFNPWTVSQIVALLRNPGR